jgi:hypothetical protein
MEKERGELTVEATIVVSTVVILIFVFIDFCLGMYNRINVTAEADRIAADVSTVYANQGAEPCLGYVSLDDFNNHNLYRHISIGQSKMDKTLLETADWYAKYRINNSEIVSAKSDLDSDIDIELVNVNELGKLQLQVTVSREYSTLCMSPFQIFGSSGRYTCKSTGYGECYDMIDYINNAKLKGELKKKLLKKTTVENIMKTIVNIKKMFDK